jgi:hypothetical protein
LRALLFGRGNLWEDCEGVAKGTAHKPDRQIANAHEKAFTNWRYDIQWVDVAHRRFLRAF